MARLACRLRELIRVERFSWHLLRPLVEEAARRRLRGCEQARSADLEALRL
jgi:hypothetical protein